jgi:flagellar motor protein MotB
MDNYKTKRFLLSRYNPMRSRKARVTGILVLAFFVIYSISGFFILPYFARKIGMEKLTALLGRTVTIDSVQFNPFTLDAVINNFEIKEADDRTTFISFKKLYVDTRLSSVVKGAPIIGEVRLEKPHIHLVRTKGNTFNFSPLMDRLRSEQETTVPEKPGKSFLFSVSNIQITDGDTEFDDQLTGTKHATTQINLAIPFISNLPAYVNSFVQPSFSALVNGKQVTINGTTTVFSGLRETSLGIELKDVDIPYYLAYSPVKLKVKVLSGKLDIMMRLVYHEYANRAPMLVLSGETRIRDLGIRTWENAAQFIDVPLLSIKDISLDLDKRKVEISSVATEKGRLTISRLKDGRMNFASLLESSPAAPTRKTVAKESSAAPWIVALQSFVVNDYTVVMADHSLVEPFEATVSAINLKAQNISTEKNAKGTVALSLRIDHGGSASVNGDLVLDPLAASLAVSLVDARLKLLQPYLAGGTQVLLADGVLTANGNLIVGRSNSEELQASVSGKLRINRFSLLDKANAEGLLKWNTLSMTGIEARSAPLSLHIRDITLSNFNSQITVNKDRTINLLEAFKSGTTEPDNSQKIVNKTAPEADKQPQSQPHTVRIDKIVLQKGEVAILDRSVKPRFSSTLSEISGQVSGLSSEENMLGEVELRAKYDESAPLKITGKINPLGKDLYADLKVDFKDMDLTSVSPYSGRYAGYTIQKGQLSLQLQYLINQNKLDAKNSIFIDQFTFGDSVESPDATSLPVRLAVALLKDRNGEIHLDIPVSGELSDPKFSVGGIILKVIVNLLEKAATSPFALLGALFGSDEQLGYADFDPGSAVLTGDTIKKLDLLEKALHDRPSLKMDIIGHADPEKDGAGLKQNLLFRRVKTQKIKELAGKSDNLSSLESVTVTPEEYPLLLKRAYEAERFPKPRNFIGFAKNLPVPEMEKLMLANLKVTEEDLKALAAERARAVQSYLLQSGQIEPERIFIVEAKTLESAKGTGQKGNVNNSCTDFQLK